MYITYYFVLHETIYPIISVHPIWIQSEQNSPHIDSMYLVFLKNQHYKGDPVTHFNQRTLSCDQLSKIQYNAELVQQEK